MKNRLLYLVLASAIVITLIAVYQGHAIQTNTQACQTSNKGMDSMHRANLVFNLADTTSKSFNVFIADESTERAYGYQYICANIIQQTRILFVFDAPILASFHMRNVKAPLDIGFFDSNGHLIDIQVMYPYINNEQITYSPNQAFLYALEAPLGFFRQHNLLPGKTQLNTSPFK